MTDRFRERLSEFRDGTLAQADEERLRRHLETCAECTETLAGLERVVARAAGLGDLHLETDLWTGIEARITGDAPLGAIPHAMRRSLGRRIAFSIPQLAAAAITLASVSAAGAWMAVRTNGAPAGPMPSSPAAGDASILASSDGDDGTAARYRAVIADLERALFDPATPLPPATALSIRRALIKIDRALEDAQTALGQLPGDAYLRQHVDRTMRRKTEFLRRAVHLAQS